MKRYKDCMLVCNENQTIENLMESIKQVLIDKGYEYSTQSSSINKATIVVQIKLEDYPQSRLILGYYSEKRGVSILNIIPKIESGDSRLDYDTYNHILDSFKDDVFLYIQNLNKNTIDENSANYTMEDIIPLSFEKLNSWLKGYPLSTHQYDTNRWYDFVISLHQSGEELSTGILAQYLSEEYNWTEEDVAKIELRLESHLSLLEYYDNYRRN